MKRLKSYRIIIFLLAIQAFFAVKTQNFELYFFVWGLIWVACLVNTTFEMGRFSRAVGNPGSAQQSYLNQSAAMAEQSKDFNHQKNPNDYGMKLIYGLLVLLNVVGYVVTVILLY